MRVLLPLALVAAAGCASAPQPGSRVPSCLASPRNRWVVPDAAVPRRVHVWIDREAQSLDGWSTYGWRRVRQALDAWNALELPVRLVEASSARDAEIFVSIVDTLPGETASRGENQAGLTRLVHGPAGELVRANILVAVRARYGVSFSLPEQQATLLHELGHALGLPHAVGPRSLMSAERVGGTITGADIDLARGHYAVVPCPSADVRNRPLRSDPDIVTRGAIVPGLQYPDVALYKTETSLRRAGDNVWSSLPWRPAEGLNRADPVAHPPVFRGRPAGSRVDRHGVCGRAAGGGHDACILRTAHPATLDRERRVDRATPRP